MTDEQVEAKFRALVEPVLKRDSIKESLDRLWSLERESDIGGLLRLFAVE
jgi:hypothetical protein